MRNVTDFRRSCEALKQLEAASTGHSFVATFASD
jgi:hypothetical protein